jgi:hypothetical protein
MKHARQQMPVAISDIDTSAHLAEAAVDAKGLPGSPQRACPFRGWDPFRDPVLRSAVQYCSSML